MDLKLYGICFKMRGGPNLLDYIQTNKPVPVELMGQIMEQMSSVSEDELKFAGKLEENWKKAFNERVPLLMQMEPDGGYNIECEVPDNLLATVRTLESMTDARIIEEYTSDYLKNICGVEADILTVDVEESVQKMPEVSKGFDLSILEEEFEEPQFEDPEELDLEEPAMESLLEEEFEDAVPMEPVPTKEGIPVEDYPEEELPMEEEELPMEEEDYPEEELPMEEEELPMEEEETEKMKAAVAGIYKDMVSNIRARNLDERLNLRIGG